MKQVYDIFLSYSHEDSALARSLRNRLKESGLRCFIAEKDIPAGNPWESTIREAIERSDRVLLLVTPRSKNSPWVVAEAGAAWALKKTLIAALLYVDPSELIEPIAKNQARVVETPEQLDDLVNELGSNNRSDRELISGQWVDPSDGDVVFFQQVRNRAVGFYDYGTGSRKVGAYIGTIREGVFEYRWRWLDGRHDGHGRMTLSHDGQRLSGEWWYGKNREQTEHVGYRRISSEMPRWLTEADFLEHSDFLGDD